jgi:hypothetical protein
MITMTVTTVPFRHARSFFFAPTHLKSLTVALRKLEANHMFPPFDWKLWKMLRILSCREYTISEVGSTQRATQR